MKHPWFWAVGLVAAVACSKRTDDAPSARPEPPAIVKPPIEVSILYGSEKKTWLEEQIQAFNATTAHAKTTGRVIHVTGKPMGSGEAQAAVVDGSEQPTVFSPASSVYVTLLDDAWEAKAHRTRRGFVRFRVRAAQPHSDCRD